MSANELANHSRASLEATRIRVGRRPHPWLGRPASLLPGRSSPRRGVGRGRAAVLRPVATSHRGLACGMAVATSWRAWNDIDMWWQLLGRAVRPRLVEAVWSGGSASPHGSAHGGSGLDERRRSGLTARICTWRRRPGQAAALRPHRADLPRWRRTGQTAALRPSRIRRRLVGRSGIHLRAKAVVWEGGGALTSAHRGGHGCWLGRRRRGRHFHPKLCQWAFCQLWHWFGSKMTKLNGTWAL